MDERRVGQQRDGRSVSQVNPTNKPLQLVFDVQREPHLWKECGEDLGDVSGRPCSLRGRRDERR